MFSETAKKNGPKKCGVYDVMFDSYYSPQAHTRGLSVPLCPHSCRPLLATSSSNADFSSCLYAPFTTTKVNACEGNTNPLQQIKSHHFLRVTSADHHHNIIACPMATRRQVPCVCAAVGFKESSERTVCLSVISTHQVR